MAFSGARIAGSGGVAAGLAIALVAGCSERMPPPSAGERPSAVSVAVVDGKEFAEAVRERRGKVVLADFWATWCIPCKELFPHTVALHRRFAEQGLAVISVSLDDPESEPEVREFLTSNGAAFPNFISRYGAAPKSVEAFAITDGALPNLKLFDRSGNLHREFVAGQFTTDQLDEAVEQLLGHAETP